jgi:hypothetical protein
MDNCALRPPRRHRTSWSRRRNSSGGHLSDPFTKDPETGSFYAGAILGSPGENLFGNPEDRGGFQPLMLQREGFFCLMNYRHRSRHALQRARR